MADNPPVRVPKKLKSKIDYLAEKVGGRSNAWFIIDQKLNETGFPYWDVKVKPKQIEDEKKKQQKKNLFIPW